MTETCDRWSIALEQERHGELSPGERAALPGRPTPRPTLTGGGRAAPAPEPVRPSASGPAEAPSRQPPQQAGAADSGGENRPNESVAPVPALKLESGRESEIWAQAVDLLTDMTRHHARNAAHLAISGPNALVLQFSPAYNQQREYCSDPTRLQRIQDTLQRVTGQPWTVRLESAV